jgi:hypothetical protein
LVLILAPFLTSVSAKGRTIVLTPAQCFEVAQELELLSIGRVQGVPKELYLNQLKETDLSDEGKAFYKFWVDSIYGRLKDVQGEVIAKAFYGKCHQVQGDLSKLYGEEI